MKIKVNYAATTGEVLGFYPENINYTNIPEPTIDIDDNEWHAHINSDNSCLVDIDSLQFISIKERLTEQQLVEQEKATKLEKIKQLTDTIIASATPDCSESEIKSWDQQLQEATKVLADENYQSVMLTLMCQHRGQNETVEQLANKIIAQAEQFKPFTAIVIAQSQALIKQLDACTTLDEVNALNVEIKVS